MNKQILFRYKKEYPKNSHAVSVVLTEEKESQVVRLSNGRKVIELGIGKKKDLTRRKIILIFRRIVALAKINGAKHISLNITDFVFPHLKMDEKEVAEVAGTNMEMANFEFVAYKTPPEEGWKFIEEVMIIGASKKGESSLLRGQAIGIEVNACRSLANTPGGEMTPRLLAEAAKKAVRGTGVKFSVLEKRDIEKLKMGGILGVSRGSDEDPKFIMLEYKGGPAKDKPVVLVGKGVTFDTGGLNLKPTEAIYEMHMDMSGGAAVIHVITLASRLKIKKNIVALIPAVENMPSGSSYRPGDVLYSMSGRTIEVLNTDAEGRIILADALTYAKRYNPRLVVDVATLTGAAMIAVGLQCSAVFTKDEKLEYKLRELGEISGDYVWPLPLWDEYAEDIKGTFGDIANTGKDRYGGAITAAMFLAEFAKDLSCPWAHIDIAPRMTSIEGEYLAKGAAGAPVRLLIKLLEDI